MLRKAMRNCYIIENDVEERKKCHDYAKKNGYSIKMSISPKKSFELMDIAENLAPSSIILFFNIFPFFASLEPLLKFLSFCVKKKIGLIFVEKKFSILSSTVSRSEIMAFTREFDSDSKTRRFKGKFRESGNKCRLLPVKRPSIFKDKKDLFFHLLRQGKTAPQIAEEIGCYHQTVYYWLNAKKIKSRVEYHFPIKFPKHEKKCKLDARRTEIIDLLQKNFCKLKISQILGCSHQALNYFLKREGITQKQVYSMNGNDIL